VTPPDADDAPLDLDAIEAELDAFEAQLAQLDDTPSQPRGAETNEAVTDQARL